MTKGALGMMIKKMKFNFKVSIYFLSIFKSFVCLIQMNKRVLIEYY